MLESLSPATLWFIAGIVLIILEMFTPGFFLASLSVGTFLAAFIAWAGGNDIMQLIGFIAGGSISLVALRPLFKLYFDANGASTNADAHVGKVARVTVGASAGDAASVKIDGDIWTVDCSEDLEVGDKVEVIARDSIVLHVKRLG